MNTRGVAPPRTPLILRFCTQALNAKLAGGGPLGRATAGVLSAGGGVAAPAAGGVDVAAVLVEFAAAVTAGFGGASAASTSLVAAVWPAATAAMTSFVFGPACVSPVFCAAAAGGGVSVFFSAGADSVVFGAAGLVCAAGRGFNGGGGGGCVKYQNATAARIRPTTPAPMTTKIFRLGFFSVAAAFNALASASSAAVSAGAGSGFFNPGGGGNFAAPGGGGKGATGGGAAGAGALSAAAGGAGGAIGGSAAGGGGIATGAAAGAGAVAGAGAAAAGVEADAADSRGLSEIFGRATEASAGAGAAAAAGAATGAGGGGSALGVGAGAGLGAAGGGSIAAGVLRTAEVFSAAAGAALACAGAASVGATDSRGFKRTGSGAEAAGVVSAADAGVGSGAGAAGASPLAGVAGEGAAAGASPANRGFRRSFGAFSSLMRLGLTIFPVGETQKDFRERDKALRTSKPRLMHPDRTFRSKVDVWLAVLFVGGAGAPLATAGWLVAHGQWRGVALLSCWGVAVLLAAGALSLPLRYTLLADAVHIRSGWLEWRVPYASLRTVAPSWSPLAGPAWSLRRVRLEFADGFILVSPDDRELFIHEIAGRCPHLVPDATGRALRLPLPHEKAAR